jgi:hypothetical protein
MPRKQDSEAKIHLHDQWSVVPVSASPQQHSVCGGCEHTTVRRLLPLPMRTSWESNPGTANVSC